VFARSHTELLLPFRDAEEAMLRAPGDWVPGLVNSAELMGEALFMEFGFETAGGRVETQVEVDIAAPIRFPSRLVLPMTWTPMEHPALLPVFNADAEVAPIGPNRTQFAVSARYDPPLGALGRAIDRALLHRIAEAVIKDFVDRAVETLQGLFASASKPTTKETDTGDEPPSVTT
jgi:hypothetical protein